MATLELSVLLMGKLLHLRHDCYWIYYHDFLKSGMPWCSVREKPCLRVLLPQCQPLDQMAIRREHNDTTIVPIGLLTTRQRLSPLKYAPERFFDIRAFRRGPLARVRPHIFSQISNYIWKLGWNSTHQ